MSDRIKPETERSDSITHAAGLDVHIGTRLRQRCAWCGAIIIDVDLAHVAVQVEPGEEPKPYSTWPVGGLVRMSGGVGMTAFEALVPTDVLPDDACGRLDDEVTR